MRDLPDIDADEAHRRLGRLTGEQRFVLEGTLARLAGDQTEEGPVTPLLGLIASKAREGPFEHEPLLARAAGPGGGSCSKGPSRALLAIRPRRGVTGPSSV